jgi:tRNA G18 (ribose-2'-O)-methylase SpoU
MSTTGQVRIVSSLDVPELHPYRTLRRPFEQRQQGIFVAEGEKVVRRLLESPLSVISLLVTSQWLDRLSTTYPHRASAPPDIFVAEKHLLQEIVGYNMHQGIMALARVPADTAIDRLSTPHLLVALDGLRQAENVGVVVRNAAGFGVDTLVVGETSCSPYLRRAVRNAMGAVFTLPILHAERLEVTLMALSEKFKTRLIVADPHAEQSIYMTDFSGNVCIILGNEDKGASPQIARLASERVRIPMHREVDSLNVASAAAAVLSEAAKQRSHPIASAGALRKSY